MEEVKTRCPHCGAQLAVSDAHVGKIGRCGQCGQTFTIGADGHAPLEGEVSRPATLAADVPAEWKVGDVILGLYEVKAVHRGGKRAVVYRVRHGNWGMDLAVKSPRPENFTTEAARNHFTAECQTWISLGVHPNMVTAYYVRTLGGIPRIFAEYVEGGSLREWIEEGKLYEGGADIALERILDVAIRFAWGLHHAHRQGIVHKDVKPANVMMTPEGEPKVTDFGLAGAAASAPGAAAKDWTGRALVRQGGLTPAFCSPEQARREELTIHSDMWSWGVSVLEMFTGAVKWKSGPLAGEALREYYTALPGGPSDRRIPAMPEKVFRVLRHVLRAGPRERPGEMPEVVDWLREAYRHVMGQAYDRIEPPPAELLADGLNNRAVSLVDLGMSREAEKLYLQALQVDPHQPEATYNLGLLRWRSGQGSDVELLHKLEEVGHCLRGDWRLPYLLGLVHLERGDSESAAGAMASAVSAAGAAVPADLAETAKLAQRCRAQAGPPRVLKGHGGAAACVSVSADGRLLLAAGPDQRAQVWDVATGMPVRTLGNGPMKAAWLAPRTCRAACLDEQGDVSVWDALSGECIARAPGGWEAAAIAVDGGGDRVAAGGADGAVRSWDLAEGRWSRAMEGHTAAVSAVSLSRDGRWGVSGSWDGTVRLWDVPSGSFVCTFRGHGAPVAAVAISPDGGWVLSGDREGGVRLWDGAGRLAAGELVRHVGAVSAVCFGDDAATSLTGGTDGVVRLYETSSRRCLRTLAGGANSVAGACLGGAGRWMILGGSDGRMRVVPLGSMADRAAGHPVLCRVAHVTDGAAGEGEFHGLVSRARQALAEDRVADARVCVERARGLSGRDRHPESLELWHELSLRSRRTALRAAYPRHVCRGHSEAVTSVAVSAVSRWAVTGGGDGSARVWDIQRGQCTGVLAGPGEAIAAVDIDVAGRQVLTGGADREVRLWDAVHERCLKVLSGHARAVTCVAMSPCGRRAVSGSLDATLRVWDLAEGRCEKVLRGHGAAVSAAAIGPDGRWAVSAGNDGTLRVWDLVEGQQRRLLEGHGQAVLDVTLSADGLRALSGGEDKAMRLWEMPAGLGTPLRGHEAAVIAASISCDGRWALSAAGARAGLWDLSGGRCVRMFEDLGGPPAAARLSPDGRWVLLAVGDALRTWELEWDIQPASEEWPPTAGIILSAFLANRDARRNWRGRTKRPQWTEGDFAWLLGALRRAGVAWAGAERVRAELDLLAARRRPQ